MEFSILYLSVSSAVSFLLVFSLLSTVSVSLAALSLVFRVFAFIFTAFCSQAKLCIANLGKQRVVTPEHKEGGIFEPWISETALLHLIFTK